MRLLSVVARVALVSWASASPHSPVSHEAEVSRRQATKSCSSYTVLVNDTCASISASTGKTWSQLLSWNPELNKQCSNLGDQPVICISNPLGDYSLSTDNGSPAGPITKPAPVPTPKPDDTQSFCGRYYLVSRGDDCSTVTAQFNIQLTDFLFLNPSVWSNCTNLWKDYYYCVQPVGAITAYPGHPKSTSTVPFEEISATSLPSADLLAGFSTDRPLIPLANGTRKDCHYYWWFPEFDEGVSPSCWSLADFMGVDREEIVLWNPSLSQDSRNGGVVSAYDYPCSLSVSVSYCLGLAAAPSTQVATPSVTPPSPRASGEVQDCLDWYAPRSTDTCEGLLSKFDVTIDELWKMNPSIGQDCTKMVLGTYYCIWTDSLWDDADNEEPIITTSNGDSTPGGATSTTSATGTRAGTPIPSPIQSGIAPNCNEFHQVASGDTCWSLTQTFNIDLDSFYSWNPAVGRDCQALQLNYFVCVGLGSQTPAPTASPSPTRSMPGVVTPTPTQSGMVDGCSDFYLVVAGDGCWAIADSHGIALDNLYDWNPALKGDCSGLWPDVYVCVGKK